MHWNASGRLSLQSCRNDHDVVESCREKLSSLLSLAASVTFSFLRASLQDALHHAANNFDQDNMGIVLCLARQSILADNIEFSHSKTTQLNTSKQIAYMKATNALKMLLAHDTRIAGAPAGTGDKNSTGLTTV